MEPYAKGRKEARAQVDVALSETVQEGARLLLQVALETGVAEFLGRFP